LRGLAQLIIAKQCNGPVGTVNLVFLHSQTKFEIGPRIRATCRTSKIQR
jgi:replicative DNA helicase